MYGNGTKFPMLDTADKYLDMIELLDNIIK